MFSNFTEETCTGTGDTLTLAGIMTGMIPFSESFADGDLVAYTLEDSAGTIKVAGIGTYVSATDDITRNDTWNWNGTAVDDSPATNITLSSGTHTVRCALVSSETAPGSYKNSVQGISIYNGCLNSADGSAAFVIGSTYQRAYAFQLMESAYIATLGISVKTLDAAGLCSIGINAMDKGIPTSSYIASGTIDITTTGFKTIDVNKFLDAGWYFIHVNTDSDIVALNAGGQTYRNTAIGWTPLEKTRYNDRSQPSASYDLADATSTLVADPSTVSGVLTQTTNETVLLWILRV